MNEGQEQRSGQLAMNRCKQAGMGRKTIVVLLVGLTLASVRLAEAQQQTKLMKIGEVIFGTRPGGGIGIGRQLLRRELRQLGYIEGKECSF
jgi:hypothetical protein